MKNNIKEKNEIIEKLKALIEELKENFPNIDEQIEEIFTKAQIFFMQNLNEYDIYSLREAILELSEEYLEEEKELEGELLFHISMIFSYIKENLHPIELADEGIVYNDIYVKFLLSLTEEDISLSYPLAVDYVNDILSREGFLRNFITEEEILENGIFFYKSVEGKILDFCFNKVLFNQTPIVLEKFIKTYDDDENVKFNKKFAKSLYQALYNTLEKKFGNIKGKNKKFSGKLLDKNIIKLQKYIQSVVDEEELAYMLALAEENTTNIFLLNINEYVDKLKKDRELGALRLSLGLGIKNKYLLSNVLNNIPTQDFLNGMIALLKNYQNLDMEDMDTFDTTVENFVNSFALNIPLITDNPNVLSLYDILLDEFKRFLVKVGSLDKDEPIENFSQIFKYFYLFKKFEFKEANRLFDKYSEDLKLEEKILVMDLISRFITGEIGKNDLLKELDNIFEIIQTNITKENEGEKDIIRILILGGYLKLLKYIITGQTDESDISKLIKAYLDNDITKAKTILTKYYDEDLDEVVKGYNILIRDIAYEVLNIYPFDKRVYQLYNPSYRYKVPKIEDNRVIWV